MAGGSRVLIVEDDEFTREVLAAALAGEGYQVYAAANGVEVERVAEAFQPHIALIDLALDDHVDGFTVARRLRARSDVALLFVTARTALDDRLKAFGVGADDYLTKPFAVSELLARIEAILRRVGRTTAWAWQAGDIVVDQHAHLASRARQPLNLTSVEFELLVAFMRHPGIVLSKVQLLADVWGYDRYDANLVEVHVSALRKKLERHGPRVIHTIRKVGYVLRA